MYKGKLKINDLKLVNHSQPLSQFLREPLFRTRYGDAVWSGDEVSFYINGEHLPHFGTISNINGLRVECFSTFMNKWVYYLLEA